MVSILGAIKCLFLADSGHISTTALKTALAEEATVGRAILVGRLSAGTVIERLAPEWPAYFALLPLDPVQ